MRQPSNLPPGVSHYDIEEDQGDNPERPDIRVSDCGSVVLLKPWTPAGVAWLEENIGEDNGYQPHWPTALVEPRYADAIIDGMIEGGLTVA